jgi:hypothetical membrane protein
MRRAATAAEYALLMAFLTGIVVQVFLAGLGVFGEGFDTHREVGWILHTMGLVILLLSILGPRTAVDMGAALGLVVLNTVQIMLSGADAAGVAALHPTLALAVLFLALWMVRRLGLLMRGPATPAPR